MSIYSVPPTHHQTGGQQRTHQSSLVQAAQLYDFLGECAFNLTAGSFAAQISIEPDLKGSFLVTVETEPATEPPVHPPLDFLTGITACTTENPECESCQ